MAAPVDEVAVGSGPRRIVETSRAAQRRCAGLRVVRLRFGESFLGEIDFVGGFLSAVAQLIRAGAGIGSGGGWRIDADGSLHMRFFDPDTLEELTTN